MSVQGIMLHLDDPNPRRPNRNQTVSTPQDKNILFRVVVYIVVLYREMSHFVYPVAIYSVVLLF